MNQQAQKTEIITLSDELLLTPVTKKMYDNNELIIDYKQYYLYEKCLCEIMETNKPKNIIDLTNDDDKEEENITIDIINDDDNNDYDNIIIDDKTTYYSIKTCEDILLCLNKDELFNAIENYHFKNRWLKNKYDIKLKKIKDLYNNKKRDRNDLYFIYTNTLLKKGGIKFSVKIQNNIIYNFLNNMRKDHYKYDMNTEILKHTKKDIINAFDGLGNVPKRLTKFNYYHSVLEYQSINLCYDDRCIFKFLIKILIKLKFKNYILDNPNPYGL